MLTSWYNWNRHRRDETNRYMESSWSRCVAYDEKQFFAAYVSLVCCLLLLNKIIVLFLGRWPNKIQHFKTWTVASVDIEEIIEDFWQPNLRCNCNFYSFLFLNQPNSAWRQRLLFWHFVDQGSTITAIFLVRENTSIKSHPVGWTRTVGQSKFNMTFFD